MLIVLAIGFTVIGVGGTYLKRRHDAKNPGLYHGGDGSGSTGVLFSRAAVASPATDASGAKQAFATPARVDQFGSDSVPSDVMAPMAMGSRTRTPSRLQRSPPSTESGDLEVREVPR